MYHPFGRSFNGTTDYLYDADGFTSGIDSKVGTCSYWFKLGSVPADSGYLITSVSARFAMLVYDASNRIQFSARDASDNIVIVTRTGVDSITAGVWQHYLWSWDLNAATAHVTCYVDDAAESLTTSSGPVDTAIDYTHFPWSMCSYTTGTLGWVNDSVSEFYLNTATDMDITVEANRRKFIGDDGKPVYLGTTGELPTGTAPWLYFNFTPVGNNAGAGDGWATTNGSPTLVEGPNPNKSYAARF